MSSSIVCYYSVLDLADRSCSDDEIRKAYRKLAKIWHPDRNIDNTEEAAERFKLIQEAYDILADPQERSWYDRNRERILARPSAAQEEADKNDIGAKLFKYFSQSCFKGFNDGPEGFFSVHHSLFLELSESEYKMANEARNSEDEEDIKAFPGFGDSRAEAAQVQAFYAVWSNFSTHRHFSVSDKWDLAEAPSRHVRRAMEAENKKLRKDAKKEFNQTVRHLISIVKKRDPRVRSFSEAERRERAEEERREKEKNIKKEETRKAMREEHLKQEVIRREEQLREYNALYGDIEEEQDSGKKGKKNKKKQTTTQTETAVADDDEIPEELSSPVPAASPSPPVSMESGEVTCYFCALCHKPFKSEAQYENHEKSAKHKANVKAMEKIKIQEEKAEIKRRQQEMKKGNNIPMAEAEPSDGDSDSEREQKAAAKKPTKAKGKQPKQRKRRDSSSSSSSSSSSAVDSDDGEAELIKLAAMKIKRK